MLVNANAKVNRLGDWMTTTNDGIPNRLETNDKIKITVRENMTIDVYNTSKHSGGYFKSILNRGNILSGTVNEVNKDMLTLNKGPASGGVDLYYFPVQEKNNLEISMTNKYIPPPLPPPPTVAEIKK